MKLRTIRQIRNLKNKRVLLRVDYNVPLGKDLKVSKTEDTRLKRTLPTINYLVSKGAKIIIMSHMGRPEGRTVVGLRMKPVGERLKQLLPTKKKSLQIISHWDFKKIKEAVRKMKAGEIMLLENLRFNPGEEEDDAKFAKALADLADVYPAPFVDSKRFARSAADKRCGVYVNDAFAVCHRANASVSAITKYLSSYAGFLLEEEIKNLSKIWQKPRRPLVVILGGAKISTKIGLVQKFLPHADWVLLGGALANTLLKAQGYQVGKSVIEEKMVQQLKKLKLTNRHLEIPVDLVVAKSPTSQAKTRIASAAGVKRGEMILDIGPDTLYLYKRIISRAKTVVWNGPMGLIEIKQFAKGTEEMIKALATSGAESIVGGGETVEIVEKLKLADSISFVSTGGGAMLEFLEGKTLPGIKPLLK